MKLVPNTTIVRRKRDAMRTQIASEAARHIIETNQPYCTANPAVIELFSNKRNSHDGLDARVRFTSQVAWRVWSSMPTCGIKVEWHPDPASKQPTQLTVTAV